jgi:threonine aldolase
VIDLRSDTVTKPTEAMKEAMLRAPLGDDVYGEDPTVNELERLGAELLGKEASLFVPSGTMGNLICMMVHAPRGSEVILGDQSHIYHYEQGGASAVASLVMHPVPTQPDGRLAVEDLAAAVRNRADVHSAWPGVVCLENTHNRCGGKVLDLPYLNQVREFASAQGVPLHLDGARLANAAVALGRTMKDLAAPFDSVQLDLSKALAAPVGGLVAGNSAFVLQARRMRKLLGGGMRQAGIIAAAGIVALTQMVDRLADDHRLAIELASALTGLPGIELEVGSVQTNLVVFRLRRLQPALFIAEMRERGVLLGEIGNGNVRMVTHYGITPLDVKAAVAAAKAVFASLKASGRGSGRDS